MGNVCHAGPVRRQQDGSDAKPKSARPEPSFGRDPTLKREDFMFSRVVGPKVLMKEPGSVNGQQFLVEEVSDCDIFVLDHCTSVQIDACTNCRIIVGPCTGSLFVRDCKNCTVVCAVQQFRSRDCSDMDVYLYSCTEPIIETSSRMRFGCFALTYFSLQHHMELAKFSVWNNKWSEIYNFTPDHDSWTCIPVQPNQPPLQSLSQDAGTALWNLPQETVARVGLSVDVDRLVIPLTSGQSVRREHEDRVLVCFVQPNQSLMLRLVTLMTAITEENAVTPVLLQTREMQLTMDQAKTLFKSNRNQHLMRLIETSKVPFDSVIMEFQGPDCTAKATERLETESFASIRSSIFVSEDSTDGRRTIIHCGGTGFHFSFHNESMTMSASAKRSLEEDAATAKRARRSRWENADKKEALGVQTSTVSPAAASNATTPKASLSDIVKKLSSVVKEKSTPQQLLAQPVATSQSVIATLFPTGAPTALNDIEAAKAKALAQASLLSMNLPLAQTSPNDLARRLYIGNLYYDLKEDDIRNVFAPFGSIKSIDLSVEPGCGRSKGFCFLEYDEVLAAESAVQVLNGVQLANRSIRVGRPHRGSSNPADANAALSIGQQAIKNIPTKCIYVGGVRVELSSHHLESIFAPFGEIRVCVMAPSSPLESGAHRGYGFLEFLDEGCAANAIQHMNGFELAGQPLKVGKASAAAITINLLTSTDKVVRDGSGDLTAVASVAPAIIPAKKTAVFDEDDVEGVKDVADASRDEKRCLCLLNLVNKGDVDDELEGEVRSECSRFGYVVKVEIHELDDHVRVFVVFSSGDAAAKSKQALHGRFFGGHQVQAHFYSLQQLESKNHRSEFL